MIEKKARTTMCTLPLRRSSMSECAKWYSNGDAVAYSPNRFAQIGDYRGFPVYREKDDQKDAIWVAIVQDGPLAPYSKR